MDYTVVLESSVTGLSRRRPGGSGGGWWGGGNRVRGGFMSWMALRWLLVGGGGILFVCIIAIVAIKWSARSEAKKERLDPKVLKQREVSKGLVGPSQIAKSETVAEGKPIYTYCTAYDPYPNESTLEASRRTAVIEPNTNVLVRLEVPSAR